MKKLELLIDEESEQFGVEAISLVFSPAIEEHFIFLNKGERFTFAQVDEEKRLLIGPALIPNKNIPRFDQQNNEEYEVYFSEATVAQAAELFLKEKRTDAYTVEHKDDVNGLSVFESWIVQDSKKDKAALYGFDVPVGTWMVSVKVHNDEVWNQVKGGEYRGFSIEGWFVDRLVHMQEGPTLEEVTLAVKEALVPIDFLDGAPLFASEFEANLYAETIGCSGSHVHNLTGTDFYMPCENHEQAIEYEGPSIIVAMEAGEKENFESYSDYPDAVKNNAKRGIELNEANGNKCATQTGKVRAQQLAKGEAITEETISRMFSYLSRAEANYDPEDPNACGTISYLLWGGKSAKSWAESKLNQLEKLELEAYPWEECIAEQMAEYGSRETAEKICGAIKAKYGS